MFPQQIAVVSVKAILPLVFVSIQISFEQGMNGK